MDQETLIRKRVCSTYNGMGREAIYWGIPIMPFAAIAMITMLITGISIFIFSFWGLLAALPGGITLIAIRVACSLDSKALDRIAFVIRRFSLNRKYGKPLLLTPYNPKWSSFYDRRFAQKYHVARCDSEHNGVPRR